MIGMARDDPEVVRYEDHRHVAVGALFVDHIENLRLHGYVERCGWLISEEHGWAASQCDGNHHALAHAPRQLVGILVKTLLRFGDVHVLE